jgi:hypothetical protein
MATKQPPMGVDHPTIVPANIDEFPAEEAEAEREADADTADH